MFGKRTILSGIRTTLFVYTVWYSCSSWFEGLSHSRIFLSQRKLYCIQIARAECRRYDDAVGWFCTLHHFSINMRSPTTAPDGKCQEQEAEVFRSPYLEHQKRVEKGRYTMAAL